VGGRGDRLGAAERRGGCGHARGDAADAVAEDLVGEGGGVAAFELDGEDGDAAVEAEVAAHGAGGGVAHVGEYFPAGVVEACGVGEGAGEHGGGRGAVEVHKRAVAGGMHDDDHVRVEGEDVGVNGGGFGFAEGGGAAGRGGLEVCGGPVSVEVDAPGVGSAGQARAVGVHVMEEADAGAEGLLFDEGAAEGVEAGGSFAFVAVDSGDDVDAAGSGAEGLGEERVAAMGGADGGEGSWGRGDVGAGGAPQRCKAEKEEGEREVGEGAGHGAEVSET